MNILFYYVYSIYLFYLIPSHVITDAFSSDSSRESPALVWFQAGSDLTQPRQRWDTVLFQTLLDREKSSLYIKKIFCYVSLCISTEFQIFCLQSQCLNFLHPISSSSWLTLMHSSAFFRWEFEQDWLWCNANEGIFSTWVLVFRSF